MHNRPSPNAGLIQRQRTKDYIQARIETALFNRVECVLRDVLEDIHVEQKNLVKSSFTMFRFRGRRHTWKMLWDTDNVPDLHPSLHERMQKFLDDNKNIEEYEKPCVNGLLRAMFTHSDFLADYQDILPESLHDCFEGYESLFDATNTKQFTPEALAEFKERNAAYIQLMRNRMLMNILL